MSLRALIVDDEPLARRRLRRLLEGQDGVEVIGECGDGRSARHAIAEQAPDLVFLDVEMPELDGFGTLAELAHPPAVIFVTAYDQYATRAFDVQAVDYLVKPYRRERFAAALERARFFLARRGTPIAVREAGAITLVPPAALDWIEAAGNYVKLHVAGVEHLVREPLTRIAAGLDPARFARIHRRIVINLERLHQLVPTGKNDVEAVLTDGTRLPVGRRYRSSLPIPGSSRARSSRARDA